MDAFAWGVIGSVATVGGAVAAIIPIVQNRRKARRNADDDSADVDLRGGQGVQVGTGNQQVNQYIQTYVESRPGAVAHTDSVVIVGEIPQAPPEFQPRDDLTSALVANGPGTVLVHALTGMRGVGKTQIAAAYARSRIDAKWPLVAWVNATDTVGVLNGLADTASRLGLDKPGGSPESAGDAVRHWLEADGERCLVVFDNVTDLDHIARYLPAAGGSRVIVTSNNVDAGSFGLAVPVDVFTASEGLTFLAGRTGLTDEAGARELGIELGWLPLALAQAGAVIAAQHLDFATYLARLRSHPVQKYLGRVKGEPYPHGTAEAITVALNAAAESDPTGLCGQVMDVIALLSAAGVRRDLLQAAGQAGVRLRPEDPRDVAAEDIDAALGRLASVSLLTFTVDNSAVIAHRLTTRVVHERLVSSGNLLKVGAAVAAALQIVIDSLDQPWRNRVATHDTAEQVAALNRHLNSYLGDHDAELTKDLLALRLDAIQRLNDLGDSFSQVIEQCPLLIADCEQTLSQDDKSTLAARAHLAYAYRAAGRLDEAILLYERTLADHERVLGEAHPDTLTSRNNLAGAYLAEGRLDEAIPLYERTLADRERVLGEAHPSILTSRNNLAGAYQAVGRLGRAIPLYERTLADRERVLGAAHPHTFGSRNNLAAAYKMAGRLSEAIPLYERTLADCEQVLGEAHPNTLTSRNNLAGAYLAEGRLDEAIPLYERTLADRERVLGEAHPDTLLSRTMLATAYEEAGRLAEAGATRAKTVSEVTDAAAGGV